MEWRKYKTYYDVLVQLNDDMVSYNTSSLCALGRLMSDCKEKNPGCEVRYKIENRVQGFGSGTYSHVQIRGKKYWATVSLYIRECYMQSSVNHCQILERYDNGKPSVYLINNYKVTPKYEQPKCIAKVTVKYEKQIDNKEVVNNVTSSDMWTIGLESRLANNDDNKRVKISGTTIILQVRKEQEVMNSKYKYWEDVKSVNLINIGINKNTKITDADIKMIKSYLEV